MHELELIKWLDKNNLLTITKNHSKYFKEILINNLNIKNNKDILILGDWGSHGHRLAPIISGAYYLSLEKLGYKSGIILGNEKTRYNTAEKELILSLKKLSPNSLVLMAFSNRPGSLGVLGKSFRRYCLERKHNFISTTGLGGLENKDLYIITNALDVDYKKMKLKGEKIKKMLDLGREIRIKTERGTDFIASIKGRYGISLDGDYKNKIRGGNMPAGEVYIAPVTGSVNGKIVIDGSSRNEKGTMIIEPPITLTVKQSQILKIEGGKEALVLEETLNLAKKMAKRPSNISKIREIGIGINPNIDIVGSMVVDEKAMNTGHIAIGSNYWFGGDIFTFLHLDQVFRNPEIFIDGKKLEY